MADRHISLAKLQEKLRRFNSERNWAQYHSPRNLAMALNVEAAELLALYLWSSDDGPQPPVSSRAEKVKEEAADVMICLLNFCDQAGIDLLKAVNSKIDRNAQKYPVEKAKGRLEKSDEL